MPVSSEMSSMRPHQATKSEILGEKEKKVNSGYLECVWDSFYPKFFSIIKINKIRRRKICACLTYFQAHKSKIEIFFFLKI
jgi:hypothetical protein